MTTPNDPVPKSAWPSFQPVNTPAPTMPKLWTATAILHPFSPPPSGPRPDNPFFQLCTAFVVGGKGQSLYATVTGCEYGEWRYRIRPEGTEVSNNGGTTWKSVDLGWSIPTDWYGAQGRKAACAGASPLNWMNAQTAEWWKIPAPIKGSPASPDAATWFWFDRDTKAPVRMMFGYGPPSPTKGDPTQLALFQMWSFTYFTSFTDDSYKESVEIPTAVNIPGFQVGNPNGYKNFVWSSNFGMTAFMTPVNEAYNPLPTRVLYVWKPDNEYKVYSDRAQNTLMSFKYNHPNPDNIASQEALLTGPSAPDVPTHPPDSNTGFLINFLNGGSDVDDDRSQGNLGRSTCIGGSQFPFPQEPPTWISTPGVDGKIQATIVNNPVVAPNTTVTIFSVLFPPAPPNYPEATYLWTWYAPQDETGLKSRPITFMQSQSGVNVGTSLALADYYYYQIFSQPIDPTNFDIPSSCSLQTRKLGLRRRLP